MIDAKMMDSYEKLSDAERVSLGRELEALVNTAGWQLFERLMTLTTQGAAMAALSETDPARPIAYYRGQVDAVDSLRECVRLAIANAETIGKKPSSKPGASLLKHIVRPGGTDPIG